MPEMDARIILLRFFMFCSLFGLLSCSASRPSDLAKDSPLFIPEAVFQGKMRGDGAVFDRFGNIQRAFVLHLEGVPSNNGVIVKERLVYDNGEEESREYSFENLGKGKYEATSESGLVGPAKIEAVGNILRWKYYFEVPYRNKIRHMRFDDWMYLQDNGNVINRATIYWWGIRVGELFMVVKPIDDDSIQINVSE
jgi:hypothetical protein